MNVVDNWFRSAKHQKMEEILLDGHSQIYKYLKPSAVRAMFNQHQTGHNDNHKILFSLIVFEEWLRSQNSARH
ncbi:MAG: hypothetical protein DMG36_03380 [Acidobacteria bacterium]|nr:MAG: hypothetical protein DMG36_03380 [Acidobacteriota bacterium]